MSLFLLAGCNKDNNTPDTPTTPTGGDGRYRGINTDIDSRGEADIRRLAGWGVNHLRWIFDNAYGGENWPLEQYYSWIEESCDSLDAQLPLLEELGVTVNVALMVPPGGRDGYAMRVFSSYELQDAFIETWRRIATRYKDNTTVVFYDLLNEPNPEGGVRSLIVRAVDAINAIDNTKKLIYPTCSDIKDGKPFEPLSAANVIYSEHVYTPHVVTHEGVSFPHGAWAYPGKITGVDENQDGSWNKAFLRLKLSNFIGFVNKYGKEFYIGEFGCARWAKNKSAYNYLRAQNSQHSHMSRVER